MKIENEKIIQATEDELYSYWLSRGWDDIYSFPEYMQRMKDAGCKVVAEILQPLFDRITASPEVLAPKFIFKKWHAFYGKWGWFSLLLMDGDKLNSPCFENYADAHAATVAKLKEVAE